MEMQVRPVRHRQSISKSVPVYKQEATNTGRTPYHNEIHNNIGKTFQNDYYGNMTNLAFSNMGVGYNYEPKQKSENDFVEEHFKQLECNTYLRDPKAQGETCQCGRFRARHQSLSTSDTHDGEEDITWTTEEHTTATPTHSFGRIRFNGFGEGASQSAPYLRLQYVPELAVAYGEDDLDDDTHHVDKDAILSPSGNHRKHSSGSSSSNTSTLSRISSVPSGDPKFNNTLDAVLHLMLQYWQIARPKLIISVTGGARSFYINSKLKTCVKQGIIKAATSTDAWIVSGGSSSGVMSFIGEAIHEYALATGCAEESIVLLGIATWGIVNNQHSLIRRKSGKTLHKAHYNRKDLSKGKKGCAPLDEHHTHFLLVDDGTHAKYGAEIKFRADLERHISETFNVAHSLDEDVYVPRVLLVIEGGPNTVVTAKESAETGTPILIIKDTGRAADLIALAYELTKKCSDGVSFTSENDEALCKFAEESMKWNAKDEESRIKQIRECVDNVKAIIEKHRDIVTIFNLKDKDTTNDLDQTLLMSILTTQHASLRSQLNLSLAFDRCDIAKTAIFTRDKKEQWESLDIDKCMLTALVDNKFEFVNLFMEHSLILSDFLTQDMLAKLYTECKKIPGAISELIELLYAETKRSALKATCMCQCCSCCRDKKKRPSSKDTLYHVGELIKYLMGGQNKNVYSVECLTRELAQPDDGDVFDVENGKAKFENPEKHLFLWAVLFNRTELAQLFWRGGRDQIGGALMAASMLKALSNEADDKEEIELSADLGTHASEFENHAVGCLSACYVTNKSMAHDLLVRINPTWGRSTLLQLSNSSELMDFMEHTCCQTKLNKIWNGRMSVNTGQFKIVASFFMPLLIFLIKFRTTDDAHITDQKRKNKRPRAQLTSKKPEKQPLRNRSMSFAQNLYPENPGHPMRYYQAVYHFYTAPVVKFFGNVLSSMALMGMMSYFLLTDLHPLGEKNSPSVIEIISMVWMGSMVGEEFRQILFSPQNSFKYKLKSYFNNEWNIFDCIVFVLHITSLVLRMVLPGEVFFWARAMYCLTLCSYFMRFMQVFYAEKNIGPKVIMIRRMVTDVMFFMCICAIFVLSYGVSSHALSYPNSRPTWELIGGVLYKPYFKIYGELFLEDFEGGTDSCSANQTLAELDPDVDRCPEDNILPLLLMVVYMLMTNVLMLNLLIAMFSYTFAEVQDNSEKVWRFHRYELVSEYVSRPACAPPLIILNHFTRFCEYIHRHCKKQRKKENDLRRSCTDTVNAKLTAFERFGMTSYLLDNDIRGKEDLGFKVTSTGERIEAVIEGLEQIKESVTLPTDSAPRASTFYSENFIGPQPATLEDRMTRIEAQLENLTTMMHTKRT